MVKKIIQDKPLITIINRPHTKHKFVHVLHLQKLIFVDVYFLSQTNSQFKTIHFQYVTLADNDVIAVKPKSTRIPIVAESIKNEAGQSVEWLKRKASVGKIDRLPERKDIQEVIDEQLMVEFYSR